MNRFVVKILLAFSLVFAFSPSAQAQKEKAENAQPKGLLKIPVWVEESGGEFWNEAKRQTFKVFIEDKELPIKSFQGPRNSTIILVVFDTVADLARVDQARAGLSEAIKSLPENYWIGLLRAQDELSVVQEPTSDRASLAGKIQAIPVAGKAGLLDTLEPVSRLATGILQKAGVRLCVLYVTDSSIANYRADYLNPVINSSDSGDLSRRFSDRAVQERLSRLAESLAEFTVPIFILHLEQRSDTLNLAYQSGLERIAAVSGGSAAFCRTADEIKPSLGKLLARIQSVYFLGVDAPEAKRQPVKIRIEAQDAAKQIERVNHVSQINLRGK
ncbi:MAG: hypothetical protein AB7U82_21160 [Blastocatellales bacterium]